MAVRSGLKPIARPAGGGLIEGATPECRGPLQVVRYQRAQDQLLSQCARLAEVDGELSLVKNDRDAHGQRVRQPGELRGHPGSGLVVVVLASRADAARLPS